MSHASARRVVLLMVDDDVGDVAYTRDIFAEYRVCNELVVIDDPLRALTYLRGMPPYAGVPVPDVVLLNLGLPGGGCQALVEALCSDAALCTIPLVVLTGSAAETRMLRDSGLPATWYLTKPFDFDGLTDLVRHLDGCYLQVERASAAT